MSFLLYESISVSYKSVSHMLDSTVLTIEKDATEGLVFDFTEEILDLISKKNLAAIHS